MLILDLISGKLGEQSGDGEVVGGGERIEDSEGVRGGGDVGVGRAVEEEPPLQKEV